MRVRAFKPFTIFISVRFMGSEARRLLRGFKLLPCRGECLTVFRRRRLQQGSYQPSMQVEHATSVCRNSLPATNIRQVRLQVASLPIYCWPKYQQFSQLIEAVSEKELTETDFLMSMEISSLICSSRLDNFRGLL